MRALPADLAAPKRLLPDAGYFGAANVDGREAAGVEPSIAVARDAHHADWSQRIEDPSAPPPEATPVEPMVTRLRSRAGRTVYVVGKEAVDPVIGIVNAAMGFRQLLACGLDNVRNEWGLACLARTQSAWPSCADSKGRAGESPAVCRKLVPSKQSTPLPGINAFAVA